MHFVPGHTDNDKGFELCRSAQNYYARIGAKTQVLPASLTSVAEVMRLKGVAHITVSPPLLAELAATPAEQAGAEVAWFQHKDGEGAAEADAKLAALVKDEARYRMAFTRSKEGRNEGKLTSAINIFADMQDGIEALVRKYAV